jgi:hypothetical protein
MTQKIILVKNKEIPRFDAWCLENNKRIVRLVLAKDPAKAARRRTNLIGYYYYIEDRYDIKKA